MIIYKATNILNDKIYIGQTIRSLSSRISSHKRFRRKNSIRSFQYHIQQIGFDNFIFEIIHECLSKSELNFYEKFYINEFKANDPKFGYNLTSGGDANYETNDVFKEFMSNISTCKRPIVVYSSEGVYLSEFDSINEASRKLNINAKNINRILKGKRKTTKGYFFKYKESDLTNDIVIIKHNFYKKITQYDLLDQKIMEFSSIKEASEKLGIDRNLIQRVLSKKRKYTHSFVFKYS